MLSTPTHKDDDSRDTLTDEIRNCDEASAAEADERAGVTRTASVGPRRDTTSRTDEEDPRTDTSVDRDESVSGASSVSETESRNGVFH